MQLYGVKERGPGEGGGSGGRRRTRGSVKITNIFTYYIKSHKKISVCFYGRTTKREGGGETSEPLSENPLFSS